MPQFFVNVAYVRDPKAWLKFTTTRGKIYNVNWSYTKILGLRYICTGKESTDIFLKIESLCLTSLLIL